MAAEHEQQAASVALDLESELSCPVNTLLDVLLQLDPSKGKSEEEKERINATYRPGDPVLRDTARSNGEARPDGADGDWQVVSGLLSRMNIVEAPDRDSALIAHSQSHPSRLYNPTEVMPMQAGNHQPTLTTPRSLNKISIGMRVKRAFCRKLTKISHLSKRKN
ncbi:hypothetical protein KEM56_006243 [Ascosphaera pollenicola]|nr:hypothetical protein KEM56_006243 [Ascosphaera pollenicola]